MTEGNCLPADHFGQFTHALGNIRFLNLGGFLEAKIFTAVTGGDGAVNDGSAQVFIKAPFLTGKIAHEAADKAVTGPGGVHDFL